MLYTANSGLTFEIISREGKQCVVRFTESGSVRKANIDNIVAGKVRDLYAPCVYGHGYPGEHDKPPYWKRAKDLWRNMLKRCYCEKDLKGYFGRVTVDARWHCFANFLEDLPKLRNFDKWLEGSKPGKTKYNLDKDLRVEGCKVYSYETCGFVTETENKTAGARNGKPFSKNKRVGRV